MVGTSNQSDPEMAIDWWPHQPQFKEGLVAPQMVSQNMEI